MVFNFKLTVLNNSTLESIPQWRIQEFYNQSALSWLGRILRGGEIVLMPFNIQPIFCSESREWKQNAFWLQLMYVHVSKFTTTNAKKTPTNKKKGGGEEGALRRSWLQFWSLSYYSFIQYMYMIPRDWNSLFNTDWVQVYFLLISIYSPIRLWCLKQT